MVNPIKMNSDKFLMMNPPNITIKFLNDSTLKIPFLKLLKKLVLFKITSVDEKLY